MEQIQNEIRQQQVELASHQNSISQQIRVNEVLRKERSLAISDAILKQCIHEYRIDGKLAALGMNLYAAQTLDSKSKTAIASFVSEVTQDQGELQCHDPLPAKLRQK